MNALVAVGPPLFFFFFVFFASRDPVFNSRCELATVFFSSFDPACEEK